MTTDATRVAARDFTSAFEQRFAACSSALLLVPSDASPVPGLQPSDGTRSAQTSGVGEVDVVVVGVVVGVPVGVGVAVEVDVGVGAADSYGPCAERTVSGKA